MRLAWVPHFPLGSRARLICEIAIATRTAPGQWWDETDETLATVLTILENNAAELRKAAKRGSKR
jgi:hypothetical protein